MLRTDSIAVISNFLAALIVTPAFGAEESRRDHPRPPIIIADFESTNYAPWIVSGKSFGAAPARGTLAGQMEVSGFLGNGLANSYIDGDNSTGRLTSGEFTIQRPWINFLVGGGAHRAKTCINLIIDGQIIYSTTGPNSAPGGSERLDWSSWDVREQMGQTATIEIVDAQQGPWGHICVDHIEQNDRPRHSVPVQRSIAVEHRYLHLPVRNGAPSRLVRLLDGAQVLREFEIELAESSADFWVSVDMASFQGRSVVVEAKLPSDSSALASIRQSDETPNASAVYTETLRPQFHFTSQRGWLNDPNGLVYLDGEYHLFYQHNPYGWKWGNMHWGHAVSRDLMHWQERPIAIYPKQFGDWAFSGSAVVDRNNTSGFKTGNVDVIVAAYTSTGRGECIVYSNDRGRSWREYEGNPVVKHKGRDPRLLWHAPTQRWIMAVFNEEDGQAIDFHSSADLKNWQFESRIRDFFECPDLLQLTVDGNLSQSKWVLYAADAKYLIGEFDGRTFIPDSGKHQLWHGSFYAAQTFSNMPDKRTVQIGWARGITFEGMPFNQQMTIPCELTLRTTPDGVRLYGEPVAEVTKLRRMPPVMHQSRVEIDPVKNLQLDPTPDLYDLEVEIQPINAERIVLNLNGTKIVYEASSQKLSCSDLSLELPLDDDSLMLRVLVDRGSIEVFAEGGRAAFSIARPTGKASQSRSIGVEGGRAQVKNISLYELKPIWQLR